MMLQLFKGQLSCDFSFWRRVFCLNYLLVNTKVGFEFIMKISVSLKIRANHTMILILGLLKFVKYTFLSLRMFIFLRTISLKFPLCPVCVNVT